MDYFKELVDEKITKEIEGSVPQSMVMKTIEDYIALGYTEFKIEVTSNETKMFKIIARGDKDKIVKKVRSWYPDLLSE